MFSMDGVLGWCCRSMGKLETRVRCLQRLVSDAPSRPVPEELLAHGLLRRRSNPIGDLLISTPLKPLNLHTILLYFASQALDALLLQVAIQRQLKSRYCITIVHTRFYSSEE